jgi:glucose/arabinose dehydrogenase
MSFPVHITHAGDGSGRLFIVEQPGRIRIVKNGVLLATPFLDISSTGANRVLFGGEQGLLSVALPPQFNAKGYFYVYYTNLNGDNVAARYFLTANPDVADPNSEVILQTFLHPTFANHNGGQLAFGPDGFLYIGTGDGGSGGDPNNNGQNLNTFLGKILRIDVESVLNPRIDTYVIPPSNPFVGTPGALPEIWALGLRNPFRFSFDRLTGDLYIGDVGQNLFEEIDFQPAASPGGQNYGWSIMEGFHCFNKLDFNNPLPTCDQAGLTLPVVEYDHTQGDCSVIGGFVYRGNLHPQMQGIYFYGDTCSGKIWGLKRDGAVWQNSLLLDSPFAITSFGEDEGGELYLTDYLAGDIYRITVTWIQFGSGATPSAPSITWSPFAAKFFVGVRGADSKIYIGSLNLDGSFNNDWTPLPTGGTPDAPAIAWNPTDNRLQIVVRGGDNGIYGSTVDATMGAFSGWVKLNTGATPSAPAIAWNPTDNRLQIVVRGGDNGIYGSTVDATMGAFSGWVKLNTGATPSAPAIAWNPTNNNLQIVVRGGDNGIYGSTVDATMGAFSGWIKVPDGATPDAPAVAIESSTNTLHLVVRGTNNLIYNLPNF